MNTIIFKMLHLKDNQIQGISPQIKQRKQKCNEKADFIPENANEITLVRSQREVQKVEATSNPEVAWSISVQFWEI